MNSLGYPIDSSIQGISNDENGNVVIENDLIIQGDTINIGDIVSVDPLLHLNNGALDDTKNTGFFSEYKNGPTTEYAGLIRSLTDKKYHLFKSAITEPNASTNITSLTKADLVCDNITVNLVDGRSIASDHTIYDAHVADTGLHSTPTKIINGTGSVDVTTSNQIQTKLNNQLVQDATYKTIDTDHVVFTTNFGLDNSRIEKLLSGTPYYRYNFTSTITTTVISKIAVSLEWLGTPNITVRIINIANTIVYATQTLTLANQASSTATIVNFDSLTNANQLVSGTPYYLEITKNGGNDSSDETWIVGSSALRYDSDGHVLDGAYVDFLIRGDGSHDGLYKTRLSGIVEIGSILDVEDALLHITGAHSNHKLLTTSNLANKSDTTHTHVEADITDLQKSLVSEGNDTIYTKEFITMPSVANTEACIAIGTRAGRDMGTVGLSEGCTIIGQDAARALTGTTSTVVGKSAALLQKNMVGSISMGRNCLLGSGVDPGVTKCVAIGNSALQNGNAADRTVCLGDKAGLSITDSKNCVVIGGQLATGSCNMTIENNNTLLGVDTCIAVGNENATALGYGAHCTKSNQCVIGSDVLATSITEIVTGIDNNCDLGSTTNKFKNIHVNQMNSLTYPNTDGSSSQVLSTNGSGSLSWTDKTIITSSSGTFNLFTPDYTASTSTGSSNLSIGNNAGRDLTGGNSNLSIGLNANFKCIAANNNMSLGVNAMTWNTGSDNCAVGFAALKGFDGAAKYIRNVAIGTSALTSMDGGERNVAIGYAAGDAVSSGSDNVIISSYLATGSCNLTTGSYNTLLGAQTCVTAAGRNYGIALGYGAMSDADNSLKIGSSTLGTTITQIVPGITSTTDLGSTSNKFKNLYVGDVSCANLTVTGQMNVSNIVEIEDNIIKLGTGNIVDTVDLGFISEYNDGASQKFTGLVRSNSTKRYHLFDSLVTEPGSTVDFGNSLESDLIVGEIRSKIGLVNSQIRTEVYESDASLKFIKTGLHYQLGINSDDEFRIHNETATKDIIRLTDTRATIQNTELAFDGIEQFGLRSINPDAILGMGVTKNNGPFVFNNADFPYDSTTTINMTLSVVNKTATPTSAAIYGAASGRDTFRLRHGDTVAFNFKCNDGTGIMHFGFCPVKFNSTDFNPNNLYGCFLNQAGDILQNGTVSTPGGGAESYTTGDTIIWKINGTTGEVYVNKNNTTDVLATTLTDDWRNRILKPIYRHFPSVANLTQCTIDSSIGVNLQQSGESTAVFRQQDNDLHIETKNELVLDNVLIQNDLKYDGARLEVYVSVPATTTIGTADTWTPVNITALNLSHSNMFSPTLSGLTYTGERARYCHISINLSAKLAIGGNDQLEFAAFDTTGAALLIPGSEVFMFIGNNAAEVQSAVVIFFELLAPNTSFRLYCKNVSSTDNIIVERLNISAFSVNT